MRMNLQLALMASRPVIATFLSFTTPYVQAEPGSSSTAQVITTTTDQSGHKVYENETVVAGSTRGSQAPVRSNSLAYWSNTEHRWKPVPTANVKAARSAAAEVNQYLGGASAPVANTGKPTNAV